MQVKEKKKQEEAEKGKQNARGELKVFPSMLPDFTGFYQ